jgi:transcriptional regulator with XRE-family HTH domain
MVAPEQVRMARAALKWSVAELARQSEVAPKSIVRFEDGGNVTIETLKKIQGALEKAGITWVPENGGPPGVRMPRRE